MSCFKDLAGAPVQPVVAAYHGCAAVPPHTMSPTAGICVDCMLSFLERGSGGATRLAWTTEEAARRGPGAPPPRQDAAAQCPSCKQLAEEAYWASQFTHARAAAREAWDAAVASGSAEAAAEPADPFAEPWRAGWIAAAGVLELGEDAVARGTQVPAGMGRATLAGLLAALLSATLALHRQGYIQAQARAAFRGDAA